MGDIATEVVIVLLLLVVNGLFAMSELAVVASRKIRLAQRAADGDRRAKAALALAESPSQFLSTVQVGISLVGVLAGAYGGATIAEAITPSVAQVPLLAPYAGAVSLAVVVAAITYCSLIIGELVPKRLALTHPETIAGWVAGPMRGISRAASPLVWLLTGSTNVVLRVLGLREPAEKHLTEDEIRAIVSEGVATGVLGVTEEALVQRVFRMSDQRVAAILTPRVDIEWVDRQASPDVIRAFLARHRHGQFPVCDGSLDRVVGVVRAADLLPGFAGGAPPRLADVMQEPLFVPDATPVFRLLEAFRHSHRHVAIVLDEFGAVEGMVTATDLLEAFVGDMPTEPAARAIVARQDGSWLIDGATGIDEVAEHLGFEALPEEESGTYHTLGGFILVRLGRIPHEGDTCEWDGLRFEVVDMDGRRVDKVLVSRRV